MDFYGLKGIRKQKVFMCSFERKFPDFSKTYSLHSDPEAELDKLMRGKMFTMEMIIKVLKI